MVSEHVKALVKTIGLETAMVLIMAFFSGISPLAPKLIKVQVSIPTIIFLNEICKFLVMLLALWLYPVVYNGYHERYGYVAVIDKKTDTEQVDVADEIVAVDEYGDVVVEENIEGPPAPTAPPQEKTYVPVTRKDLLRGAGLQSAWRFSIIAALYVMVNNLKLYAMIQLDPGTFTLLNNISILTTAFLYRLVMRRLLTDYQIVALISLVTGLLTSKLDILMGTAPAGDSFKLGLVVMIIASLCSSLADVGVEFAFKHWAEYQHFVAQSISLYFFGVIFNGLAIAVLKWGVLIEEYAMVLNLGWGWVLVFMYSWGGMLIGFIFRFSVGGNITKIFGDAGGIALTLVLEGMVLGIVPTAEVWLGVVGIYCALYIYMTQAEACDRLNGTLPHGKK